MIANVDLDDSPRTNATANSAVVSETSATSLQNFLKQFSNIDLSQMAKVFSWILIGSSAFVICCYALVLLCLLLRWFRVRFGARLEPDGRKAILITGATSGFGLATAKRLHQMGFSVIACYYNQKEPGYIELDELSGLNERGHKNKSQKPTNEVPMKKLFLIKMDVTSAKSIQEAHVEIERHLKDHNLYLTCVLNNAGSSFEGPFEIDSVDAIRHIIGTNLMGPMMISRQFLTHIIKNKGRIVNVSSGLLYVPDANVCLYGSSKCGLNYFSDSLHDDIKAYGASCHTLVPGLLTSNSNIILQKVKFMQESESHLGEEELELFGPRIRAVTKMTYRFWRDRTLNKVATKLAQSEVAPADIAVVRAKLIRESLEDDSHIYDLRVPDEMIKLIDESELRSGSRFDWLTSWRLWMIRFMAGAVSANMKMDDSPMIECFIEAICLRQPPRRIYPGNRFYANYTGPLAEYLPPGLMQFFYKPLVSSAVRHGESKKSFTSKVG